MSDLFDTPPDSTELSEEDKEGLIPGHITFRHELNAAEQANILDARVWALGRKHKNLLTEAFLKKLHKQMYGQVWKWAGQFRRKELNIGVPYHQIPTEVKKMFDDVAYWLEQDNGLTHDEIAAQLHHRITYIHPFPNGNGRLARMMADLLLEQLKCPPFTWGTGDHQGDAIISDPAVRERYVQAVKAADGKNFEPLMGFVRS